MFSTAKLRSVSLVLGRAEPATGRRIPGSMAAVLKLITSMKNVISWNTISRIGVKFGSADMADRARFDAMAAQALVFRRQRLLARTGAQWCAFGRYWRTAIG